MKRIAKPETDELYRTHSGLSFPELLFRLDIVSDLFCGTILIFIVLTRYRLLKGVELSGFARRVLRS